MKALTISQPFASLIADGAKWIENRNWETLYRGPLAIHAGKGDQYLTKAALEAYPRGVVAVCNLVACFRLRDLDSLGDRLRGVGFSIESVRQHEHAEGPWCWLLTNTQRLREPVGLPGALGLWDWRPTSITLVCADCDRDVSVAANFRELPVRCRECCRTAVGGDRVRRRV